MPTLEELLRTSLKGANEKFHQANEALHAAVVEATKAVEAVTGGKANLRLQKGGEDESSVRYELHVRTGDQARALGTFIVTKQGSIHRQGGVSTDTEQFDSPEQLSAFFQKLASDPNSRLVAFLAYILRYPTERE
jgi:hypothetical protein